MADLICRWRNGTPKNVMEVVNSMPHHEMPEWQFRDVMNKSVWGNSFSKTVYQFASQLALYYISDDGVYHPRFDHDINELEAKDYMERWLPKYYIPNPYVSSDGFNKIKCPTLFLKSLYDYAVKHPDCTYEEAYKECFQEIAKNNDDIIRNYINSYAKVLIFQKDGRLSITDVDPQNVFNDMDRNDRKAFFDSFNLNNVSIDNSKNSTYRLYITAIRTKPFLLLAGISGTGKSRIVRKLAQMTVTEKLQRKYDREYSGTNFENDRWNLHTPANFKLIQVKPNWHNSMDVVGYLTNIPEPHYVFTPFVEFIARAWQHQDIPFFLCLDEMNLAPVEEYFAEFLSAIESRAFEDHNGEKVYVTDPIIKPFNEFSFKQKDGTEVKIGDAMVNDLFPDFKASDAGTPLGEIVEHFKHQGLTLPKNLIVIGTVNMDETTYSFSRKVLDRAMSFEMNDVDYAKFLKGTTDDELKSIREELKENLNELLTDRHIEAKEVITGLGDNAGFVVAYLDTVNKLLAGTPFELGYRAANEAILYVMAARETRLGDAVAAMNDFTLMKILSRFEGDSAKMRIDPKDKRLQELGYSPDEVKDKRPESSDRDTITILSCMHKIIEDMLMPDKNTDTATDGEEASQLTSLAKLESMMDQLNRERFVSYWN